MSSIGTGYDLSSSTYSLDGRIFQVEYAMKAVDNSGLCIGLRAKDGIVLAISKLVHSKLLVPKSNKRLASIDQHIGMACAGLVADGRALVSRARAEAQNYKDNYRTPISGKMIADRMGQFVQAYTLYSSVRPFGCSALIATYDKTGPSLYMIDPSGVYWGYYGCAVGKGKQIAKAEIEKLKLNELSSREAVKEIARIIYSVMEDDIKDREYEMEYSWICDESNKKHVEVPRDLIDEAERLAKESLEDEMDDE